MAHTGQQLLSQAVRLAQLDTSSEHGGNQAGVEVKVYLLDRTVSHRT